MHKNLNYRSVRISQGVLLGKPVVSIVRGAVEGIAGKNGCVVELDHGSYATVEIEPSDDMVSLMMRMIHDDRVSEKGPTYNGIVMEYVEACADGDYVGSVLVPTYEVYVVDFVAYLTKVVIEHSWRDKFSVQVLVRNSFEDVVGLGMVVQFSKSIKRDKITKVKKESAHVASQ